MMARQWFWLCCIASVSLACSEKKVAIMPETFPVFPNAAWYTADASTATGYALRQPDDTQLRNFMGNDIDWRHDLAGTDGFSPLQPILIYTEAGCPDLLPPGHEADSVADDSPIWLTDGLGERIPWFGEAAADPEICQVFPLKAFAEGLSATVTVKPTFAATLANGADLPYAWSFPVGTFWNRVARGFAMRDAAMVWLGSRKILLTLEENPPDGQDVRHALKTWKGTMRVPDFTGPDGRAQLDTDGRPIVFGEEAEQFFLVASTSVTENVSAIPLVQYGHGLFGDPREVFSGGQAPLRLATKAIFGSVAWGMSVRYFARAADALIDPTELGVLGDKVLQSVVNQVLLSHLMQNELAPILAADLGQPVSSSVDYIGISQGGILGSPLMALSPHIRRAVLHVGGGGWTPMMTHSSNWTSDDGFGYGDIVDELLPDPTQRTLALAAWQSIWDTWDPAIFAPFWSKAPAEVDNHRPPSDRQVYYPYAIDDPQVANFSSETVARTIDMPLLSPSITQPFGVARAAFADGPYTAVASQWDVGGGQPAHSDIRQLPAFAARVAEFLRSGQVVDTCDNKACVFAPLD